MAASTLRYFKCLGQMNCPWARIFACGKHSARAAVLSGEKHRGGAKAPLARKKGLR